MRLPIDHQLLLSAKPELHSEGGGSVLWVLESRWVRRTVDDDLRPHVLAVVSRAPMQRPYVLHPAVTALQVEPTRPEVPTIQDVVVVALVATQHNWR